MNNPKYRLGFFSHKEMKLYIRYNLCSLENRVLQDVVEIRPVPFRSSHYGVNFPSLAGQHE